MKHLCGEGHQRRWDLNEGLLYTEYCDLPVTLANLALIEKPKVKNIKGIPK